VIFDAGDARQFRHSLVNSFASRLVDDVAGEADDTVFFLVNDGGDFTGIWSQPLIACEKRAKVLIQSPIFGSDTGGRSGRRDALLPGINALGGLGGRRSDCAFG
jgi:hypothetical protein